MKNMLTLAFTASSNVCSPPLHVSVDVLTETASPLTAKHILCTYFVELCAKIIGKHDSEYN